MIALSYQLTGTGWAECTVSIGREHATLVASYLSDALGDLCAAVIGILRGQRETRVTFTEEPGEYRWRLTAITPERIRVEIADAVNYNGRGAVILSADCSTRSFASALLTALQHLHSTLGPDGYRKQWVEYDFPLNQMAELAKLLET